MHDTWTSSSIVDLSDSEIKSFQEIVLRNVKNKNSTSEEKTILLNNLDLWLFCLRNIRRELELQLTQFKNNLKSEIKSMRDNYTPHNEIEDYIIDENKWRNSAIKFMTAIERKTLYVKLLIDSEN